MKIASKDFRVREGKQVNLKKWPTKIEPFYESQKQCKKLLRDRIEETSARATSTRESPWYVVPADDKPNTWLIISQIIVDTLDGFKMEYPKIDEKYHKELRALRKLLVR